MPPLGWTDDRAERGWIRVEDEGAVGQTDAQAGGRARKSDALRKEVPRNLSDISLPRSARELEWGGGERVAACRWGQRGVARRRRRRGLADQKKEVETMPRCPSLLADGHDQHDQGRKGRRDEEREKRFGAVERNDDDNDDCSFVLL